MKLMRSRMVYLIIGSVLGMGVMAATVYAAGIIVAPFSYAPRGLGTFAPGGGPPALARWEKIDGDWQLFLAKNVPTPEIAASGAQINGVTGLSTTGLTIGFTVEDGWCGAGAPRFNVRLQGTPGIVFLGCANAQVNGDVHSFTAGNSYGGVLFPSGDVIDSISILFDEGTDAGLFVYLDDIFVGDDSVGAPGHSDQ